MNTNTITSSFDGPRNSFFLEDTDEPGMATNRQKQTIKDLVFLNINESENQEMYINQLRDISEREASILIKELENGMW